MGGLFCEEGRGAAPLRACACGEDALADSAASGIASSSGITLI